MQPGGPDSGETNAKRSIVAGFLGSVTLMVDGHDQPLPRIQVRRLLALLACRPQVWRADELTEQLWPTDQPDDPVRALRVTVSRLRQLLGPWATALVTVGDGYRLDGIVTDLAQFDALCDRSRRADDAHEALALLGRAVGLFRGTPFADCGTVELLERRRMQLDGSLRVATIRRCELLARVGAHDEAVAIGAALLAENPDDERVAIVLAGAHAATGRKRQAMAILEATRRALRDGGLDPGRPFAALERSVLTGAIDLSDAAPVSIEPDRTFVGRTDDLARLSVALVSSGLHLVVGDPGIGKSAFGTQALATARAANGRRDARVTAPSHPIRPLEAIRELAQHLLVGRPSDLAEHRVVAEDLGLSPGSGRLPPSRDALMAAYADVLGALAPSERTVIWIDDAHHLDDLSLEILETPTVATCAMLLTARPSQEQQRLEAIAATVTRLDCLERQDSDRLVASRLGVSVNPELAANLWERTGGSPLFTHFLLDHLLDGADSATLPTSVLLAVRVRLDHVRPRAVQVLEAAATLGVAFSIGYLRLLSPGAADSALDESAAAGLIVIEDDGRARFAHAVIAEAIEQLLPAGRRIELHDRAGRQLFAAGASPAAYARHFEQAASIDAVRACRALTAAAHAFVAGFAWDLAIEHTDRAQAVHETYRLAEDAEWAELLLARGTAQRERGDEGSDVTLFSAAVAALGAGAASNDLCARIAIQRCSHGRTLSIGRVDGQAREFLLAVLDSDLAPARRAEVCAVASTLLSLTADHALARRLFHEALALGDSLANPELQRFVMRHADLGLSHMDDFHLRADVAKRLADLADDDPDARWEAAYLALSIALVRHDTANFDRLLQDLRDICPLVRSRPRSFGLAMCEAAVCFSQGRHDQVEALLLDAFAVGVAFYPMSWVMGSCGALFIVLRDVQGRAAELRPTVNALLADAPDYPHWQLAATWVAIADGDLPTARTLWRTLIAGGVETALPPDPAWTGATVMASQCAIALGDRAAATLLADMLRPYSDRMASVGIGAYRPIKEALHSLATFLEDPEPVQVGS